MKDEDYQLRLHEKINSLNRTVIVDQHIIPRYGVLLSKHNMDHNHYTVKFTMANIHRGVALLRMHGHLRENEKSLNYLTMNDELFKKGFHLDSESLESNLEQSNDQGVYLYIDSNRDWIIRAGSTCTSFRKRHKEHTHSAKLKSDESKQSRLYCSYPHSTANNANFLQSMKRGEWSDLKIVTGVRWTKNNKENVVNLFKWDSFVVNMLQRSRVKLSLLDKKEKMVSYLFETILGLCIAPERNISSNPSYECFNGRFKA